MYFLYAKSIEAYTMPVSELLESRHIVASSVSPSATF